MYLKEILKKNSFFFYINKHIKCYLMWIGRYRLNTYYTKKAKSINYEYSKEDSINSFKSRHKSLNPNFLAKPIGKLRVFWIGTNINQDNSGFLQALKKICDVKVYENDYGDYGIRSSHFDSRMSEHTISLVKENDEMLLANLKKVHASEKVHLVFGQLISNYISLEALSKIHKLGIPIINISMDDRLPENWAIKKGRAQGSFGLASELDLVLTTSPEACSWYGLESCPAVFWPLASSKDVFKSQAFKDRDIDVLFIGNNYGVRSSIINKIIKSGIKISCYGSGWKNGSVNYTQMANLSSRAKIILGIGAIGYCQNLYTLKLRDFDAPTSGALYLTQRNPDLYQFFDSGTEIEFYGDANEAVRKIKYYLKNSEALFAVAKKGQEKALNNHSWEDHLIKTFSSIGLISKS